MLKKIAFYADDDRLTYDDCQKICTILALSGDIVILEKTEIVTTIKKIWQKYHQQKSIFKNYDALILLAHRPIIAIAAMRAGVRNIYSFGFGITGLIAQPPHLSEEMQLYDFTIQLDSWCALLKEMMQENKR